MAGSGGSAGNHQLERSRRHAKRGGGARRIADTSVIVEEHGEQSPAARAFPGSPDRFQSHCHDGPLYCSPQSQLAAQVAPPRREMMATYRSLAMARHATSCFSPGQAGRGRHKAKRGCRLGAAFRHALLPVKRPNLNPRQSQVPHWRASFKALARRATRPGQARQTKRTCHRL